MERDGLAERQRQDEERVAANQARQARLAPVSAEAEEETTEEETPKPKSRSKKTSK